MTGFARYPDRRPAGVVPAPDGSLDVDHLWMFWGRRLGFSRLQLLQHIADLAISDSGRRQFLLRSDSEGRTWVTVAGALRRMPRRHRHRARRGSRRVDNKLSHIVSSHAGADDTPSATALDPVSVSASSDEDDDVPACESNASVDPDDTFSASDVKQECHPDQVSVSTDQDDGAAFASNDFDERVVSAAASPGVANSVKRERHHESESEPESFPTTLHPHRISYSISSRSLRTMCLLLPRLHLNRLHPPRMYRRLAVRSSHRPVGYLTFSLVEAPRHLSPIFMTWNPGHLCCCPKGIYRLRAFPLHTSPPLLLPFLTHRISPHYPVSPRP